MPKQVNVPRKRDPRLAMLTADAFARNSKLFTDSLPKDMHQSANVAAQNLGGLFASATNLALAVELYLKSLMILLRMDIPNTHELWAIFKRLPPKLRSEIEIEFDSSFDSVPGQPVGLLLDVWAGGEPKALLPEILTPAKGKYDIKSVLKRGNNAFVTWRYIYEMGEEGRHVFIEYEYGRLGVLCEILHRIIESGLRDRKITIKN